eukprot:s1121_g2.t1
MRRKFVEARVRFLRRCPRMLKAMAMSEANDQEIRVLAQSLKEQTFRSHDVICKQDHKDFMVLVRSGTLLQVRAVDPRAHMKQELPLVMVVVLLATVPRLRSSYFPRRGRDQLRGQSYSIGQDTPGEE